METKKTAAILAGCLLAAAGLFLLLDSGPDEDAPISETIDSPTTSRVGGSADNSDQTRDARPSKPTTPEDSAITKEQFERLSAQDQNKLMEESLDSGRANWPGFKRRFQSISTYLSMSSAARTCTP